MTDRERLTSLKRLKTEFQEEVLRSGSPLKHEHFAELWPTLSFNVQYCANAQKAAELLVSEGLTRVEYANAETELNTILVQAISELEHGLAPPPPEALESI